MNWLESNTILRLIGNSEVFYFRVVTFLLVMSSVDFLVAFLERVTVNDQLFTITI